ncbi:MAG TPA: tetratricopeptide repeat protein [Pyrinomonadaceae bacterium]|nr:tetratricopeptide repeat protein [Pyrinomonadaceae bacterium]
MEPSFWIALLALGKLYIHTGRTSQALEVLQKARQFCGGSTQPIAMLGYTYARLNDRKQAIAALNELESRAADRYVPPYNFALVYHGLSDAAQTFAWLEKAFQARDVLLSAFVNTEPFWDPLRNDSRFVQLIKRMNLA